MFTRSGNDLAFDSVQAIEGKFFIDPSTREIDAVVKLAYTNRETGMTYGKCVVKSALFSKETIEALRSFLNCVEEDYGSLVFKQGDTSGPLGSMGLGTAESEEGVKPKALGGV